MFFQKWTLLSFCSKLENKQKRKKIWKQKTNTKTNLYIKFKDNWANNKQYFFLEVAPLNRYQATKGPKWIMSSKICILNIFLVMFSNFTSSAIVDWFLTYFFILIIFLISTTITNEVWTFLSERCFTKQWVFVCCVWQRGTAGRCWQCTARYSSELHFHGNMKYNNMIYCSLFVFIILTYYIRNWSPELKLLVK